MATNNRGSSKLALLGAALCCIISVAFASAAVWQHDVSNSKADDAVTHAAAATLFQQAETEGTTAGQLLRQYVQTGDETLLAQINDHTAAGVSKLTTAVEQSGISAQPLLDGGTKLVQGEGQIIALRQSGDVQGAAAGLEQMSSQFAAFLEQQGNVITSEQQTAMALQDDSDAAETAENWLIMGTGMFALAAIGFGALHMLRSSSRRRTLDATTAV